MTRDDRMCYYVCGDGDLTLFGQRSTQAKKMSVMG